MFHSWYLSVAILDFIRSQVLRYEGFRGTNYIQLYRLYTVFLRPPPHTHTLVHCNVIGYRALHISMVGQRQLVMPSFCTLVIFVYRWGKRMKEFVKNTSRGLKRTLFFYNTCVPKFMPPSVSSFCRPIFKTSEIHTLSLPRLRLLKLEWQVCFVKRMPTWSTWFFSHVKRISCTKLILVW